jgi:hypothetical protein
MDWVVTAQEIINPLLLWTAVGTHRVLMRHRQEWYSPTNSRHLLLQMR